MSCQNDKTCEVLDLRLPVRLRQLAATKTRFRYPMSSRLAEEGLEAKSPPEGGVRLVESSLDLSCTVLCCRSNGVGSAGTTGGTGCDLDGADKCGEDQSGLEHDDLLRGGP